MFKHNEEIYASLGGARMKNHIKLSWCIYIVLENVRQLLSLWQNTPMKHRFKRTSNLKQVNHVSSNCDVSRRNSDSIEFSKHSAPSNVRARNDGTEFARVSAGAWILFEVRSSPSASVTIACFTVARVV